MTVAIYAYEYDEETNGILLTPDDTKLVMPEARPVYASELKIWGFDQWWKFDDQDDAPLMWGEAARLYYNGQHVANISGGNAFEKPVPDPKLDVLPEGSELDPCNIDLMLQKNEDLLEILEDTAVMRAYHSWQRHKDTSDIVHVAFSGGKDSMVLLEIIQRALPPSAYCVIFADTGMEFPSTYALVDKVETQCVADGIAFYRARSWLDPEESWRIVGPPSRTLRWCCSVHKSTPQQVLMKDLQGCSDPNYSVLDFTGVRRNESTGRRNYDFEAYSMKVSGQWASYPILDWSSAEVWLYIYWRKLLINDAYKYGVGRVGCSMCPMSGGVRTDWLEMNMISVECAHRLCQIIADTYKPKVPKPVDSYISHGGWNARKNGRDLPRPDFGYQKEEHDGYIWITVENPSTEWSEWMKIFPDNQPIPYEVQDTDDGYIVKVPSEYKHHKMFSKLQGVFQKSAACFGCETCAANCPYGCITFDVLHRPHVDGDRCRHCFKCWNPGVGCRDCVRFHSLVVRGGNVIRKEDDDDDI